MRNTDHWELLRDSFSESEILGHYDFTLCQRPDGSYYGISDGSQCRKGKETDRPEKEITRSDLLKQYRSLVGSLGVELNASRGSADLDRLDDEEFARVLKTTSDMISEKPGQKMGVISVGEHRAILQNEQFLRGLEKNPKLLEGKLRTVTDNELNATWALLPKNLQNKFKSGGVDAGTALNQDGELGSPTVWRGKETLRKFLAQNGRDPFTGLKLSIYDAELEHIQGVDQIGIKNAERKDNWAWIRTGVNRQKGGQSISEFIDSTKAMSESQVADKYKATMKRRSVTSKLDAAKDARLLAEVGYNVYKKWPENKLPRLMTQIGVKNRYVERLEGGRTAGRPGLQNKLTTQRDPDGKRVSAQGWIVLNWGRWSPQQRESVKSFINGEIIPSLQRGTTTRVQAARELSQFFTQLDRNKGGFTPQTKSIEERLDDLLASIRRS